MFFNKIAANTPLQRTKLRIFLWYLILIFYVKSNFLAIVYLWYESNFYIRITEKASKTAKRRVKRKQASLYFEGEAFSSRHDSNHV